MDDKMLCRCVGGCLKVNESIFFRNYNTVKDKILGPSSYLRNVVCFAVNSVFPSTSKYSPIFGLSKICKNSVFIVHNVLCNFIKKVDIKKIQ